MLCYFFFQFFKFRNTLAMLETTFNIFKMFKLFLKHAYMQNANFGHTTAAPDILKTSS